MEIITLSYKQLVCNSHVALLEDGQAIVFDVGQSNEAFLEYLKKHNLTLQAVFITHGHLDHIRGLEFIDKSVPVYIYETEAEFLTNPHLNCSDKISPELIIERPTIQVTDDEVIKIADHEIKVIHTPFHTSGSVCYLLDGTHLFTGDTLFRDAIGRDDLPSAMPRKTRSSLNKLKALLEIYPDLKVYPGHGPNTSLKKEVPSNSGFKE